MYVGKWTNDDDSLGQSLSSSWEKRTEMSPFSSSDRNSSTSGIPALTAAEELALEIERRSFLGWRCRFVTSRSRNRVPHMHMFRKRPACKIIVICLTAAGILNNGQICKYVMRPYVWSSHIHKTTAANTSELSLLPYGSSVPLSSVVHWHRKREYVYRFWQKKIVINQLE